MEGKLMSVCRICGDSGEHEIIMAREMMFGSRDLFEYFRCAGCGSLQIRDIPRDLGKYYAGGYYSHGVAQVPPGGTLSNRLHKLRLLASLNRSSQIGRIANALMGELEIASWFKYSGCGLDSRILDVGCGNGRLLLRLRNLGFDKLDGIDPYLDKDIDYGNGVVARRGDIYSVAQKYDLVMMHHSLEHVEDPISTLTAAAAVMNRNACLLIRIPLVDCEAWDIYRENWVQLDAPRHLHLLTRKAVRVLADRCGLKVTAVVNDSHAMQFWGSEQYRLGISLRDQEKSLMVNPNADTFSKNEIRSFAKKANEMNKIDRGDQACFFMHQKNYINSAIN